MLIDEQTDDGGEATRVMLEHDAQDAQLVLVIGEERVRVPEGALEAVMRRYGKPLDEGAGPLDIVERLELGGGASLERFRFLRRYDVIARDYLVYREDEEPALCEMATAVTAALVHLARRITVL